MKIFCGFKSRNDLDLIIATNLSKMGHEVDLYRYFPEVTSGTSKYDTNNFKTLFLEGSSNVSMIIKNILYPIFIFKLINIIIKYDCFFFFAGYSLLSFPLRWNKLSFLRYLDIVLLNKLGKKIIYTFQGSELRFNGQRLPLDRKRAIYNSEKIFVSTPDLISYIPSKFRKDVNLIQRPFHVHREIKRRNSNYRKSIKILHAPSNPKLKGTIHIEKAIEAINSNTDYNLELIILTNVSKNEVYETAKQCDFAIDQLIVGWYGVFTLEMLSLGLPVMCYISDSALDSSNIDSDEIPIFNIHIDSIIENILSACRQISNQKWLDEFETKRLDFFSKYYSEEALQEQLSSILKDI